MNHAEREDIIDIVTDICIKNQSHGIGPASKHGRQIQQEQKQEGQTDPSKHHERKSFYQFCQCLPPEEGTGFLFLKATKSRRATRNSPDLPLVAGKFTLRGHAWSRQNHSLPWPTPLRMLQMRLNFK
jgi:hypothetical protein